MRLISFRNGSRLGAGILRGDDVLPLSSFGYSDALAFLSAGEPARTQVTAALRDSSTVDLLPLASIHLLTPILHPPKILCVGLNYRDHAIEAKMEIPKVPTIFVKLSNALIGPGAPIVLPAVTQQVDYEAEFAFVIGRGGKHISRDCWRDHVFGYTILNDVSARDIQLATSQWTLGKSLDTFAPVGPHIVTADEVPDPHSLDIRLSICGETLQHSNTRELIFGIPELIEYISHILPLEPGDIISTGTPSGVGLGRKPPRWLRPGEEVVIEIQKIGTLRNPVVAER
jgi:2-keto-4-pentenoate hydratase/2-oxohepta-3-ene-1,7-dioic acid hydratase in catechol pathway